MEITARYNKRIASATKVNSEEELQIDLLGISFCSSSIMKKARGRCDLYS
jgi:hypothetical protein